MKPTKMKLKFIQIAVADRSDIKFAKYFNDSGTAMGSLFLGYLHEFHTDIYFKICIDCWQHLPELSEFPLPNPKDLKDIQIIRQRIAENTFYYQNYYDTGLETVEINRRFDFDKWWKADKPTRKRMMIDEIYYSMLFLAEKYNWATEPLHKAYNKVNALNLENNWYIKKFSKTSSSRKHSGNIWVEYDIDSFRTYIVIKDKQDNIIQKKQVHIIDYSEENANPLFETDFVFKGKTLWENNIYKLIGSNGKLIGFAETEQPVERTHKLYSSPENIVAIACEPNIQYEKVEF